MNPEGRLTIDLHRRGRRVERAAITSSRPLKITDLFVGRQVGDALEMVPLLFSVCASAQACAATRACEEALSVRPEDDVLAAGELIVLSENAREHVLRILHDWPRFIPKAPLQPDLRAIAALPRDMEHTLFAGNRAFALDAKLDCNLSEVRDVVKRLRDLLEHHIFGEPIDTWRSRREMVDLQSWLEGASTVPAQLLTAILEKGWGSSGDAGTTFLPSMNAETLHERLSQADADAFIASPTWHDETCETSALSRQSDTDLIRAVGDEFGAGLLTRLCARLVELASIPAAMFKLIDRIEMSTGDERANESTGHLGCGLHQVEAARGRLVHAVKVQDDHIASYRILAPTEWNFHASGSAKKCLETLTADDERDLRDQAELLLTAIDPCVGYDVRVH